MPNPSQRQSERSPLIIVYILAVMMPIVPPILIRWKLIKLPVLLDEFLSKQALFKHAEQYELEIGRSQFLQEIAMNSGLSENAKITVCNLQRECRHLQGNIPPKSAASLIKIPIAVALMHKLTTEKIDLDTEIYLDKGNVTEDRWSKLEANQNYSLRQLLAETIINSSNTAPNQLIDYLNRNYINQLLEKRGYRLTRVNSKFIGKTTVPVDLGNTKNSLTADELTAMMLQIYNQEHPGYGVLIKILSLQYDRELGFAGLEGTNAKWLGEKTGQTSLVLGTTLAMNLTGKIYIVTVIDDGDYTEEAIRNSVTQIANYLDRNRGF